MKFRFCFLKIYLPEMQNGVFLKSHHNCFWLVKVSKNCLTAPGGNKNNKKQKVKDFFIKR